MLSDIHIQRLVDALTLTANDPRRVACNEAFFFLEILRTHLCDLPDVTETVAIIAKLDRPAAAVISSDTIAEGRGTSSLFAKPEDGAIVLFTDFSFLWFDDQGRMGDEEGQIMTQLPPLRLELLEDRGFSIMATTKSMARLQVGQAMTPVETFADYDEIVDDLIREEHDKFDPQVDASDMSAEQSWDEADEDKLRRSLDVICLGLGLTQDDDIHLHFTSSTEQETFSFSLLEHAPDISAEGLINALKTCLTYWINTDVFRGHEYIANGQDSERRSGWDMAAMTVLTYRFDPADTELSNHQRINAGPLLRLTLKEAGLPDACMDAIIAAIRAPGAGT